MEGKKIFELYVVVRWLRFLKEDEKGSEKNGVEKSEEGEGVVMCGEEREEERESG